jgi:hypothetical protein
MNAPHITYNYNLYYIMLLVMLYCSQLINILLYIIKYVLKYNELYKYNTSRCKTNLVDVGQNVTGYFQGLDVRSGSDK